MIVNQYLLGLGEFGLDSYENFPNRSVIWVYFLVATFLTQLTFLNMLIAIMGDTYARVTENKEQESLKERTAIYADFLWAIKLDKTFNNKKYLYITTPVEDEEAEAEADSENWEGSVSKIKKSINRNQKKLEQKMDEQASQFRSTLENMLIELKQLANKTNYLEENIDNKFEELGSAIKQNNRTSK